MKATINGITVEGTVDEIIEYSRKVYVDPNKYGYGTSATPHYVIRPQITCNT